MSKRPRLPLQRRLELWPISKLPSPNGSALAPQLKPKTILDRLPMNNLFSLCRALCFCCAFVLGCYALGCEIGRGLAAVAAGTAVPAERAVAASFEAQRALMNEQLQQLRRNAPVEPSTEQ